MASDFEPIEYKPSVWLLSFYDPSGPDYPVTYVPIALCLIALLLPAAFLLDLTGLKITETYDPEAHQEDFDKW